MNCASVLLVVGTSGVVYPAAGLVDIAVEKGIPFIEINPVKTPFSEHAAVFLPFSAAVALPEIVSRIQNDY